MEIEGQGNEMHANAMLTPIPMTTALDAVVEDDKKRSSVWLDFIVIDGNNFTDGKKRAQCSHCKKATFIAIAQYGTSNMKKHLEKCKAYQATKASEERGGEKRFEEKIYRDLLARAIIRHGYSFSWVEHEGNKEIHTYLNNEVRTITRNTTKADCLKLHAQFKKQLKLAFLALPGCISLTCDMWTSCQTEGYLCLIAHYVDSDWKLTSKVLNLYHLEPPHTGSIGVSIPYYLFLLQFLIPDVSWWLSIIFIRDSMKIRKWQLEK